MNDFPGRRAALPSGRKIRPAIALAVGAPLVTALALVVQAPADTQTDTVRRPPHAQTLTSADLFCPSSEKGPILLASAAGKGAEGAVTQRVPGTPDRVPVPLTAGGTTRIATGDNLLIRGHDGLAGGLFGARISTGRPAVRECTTPVGVRWFVGAGSGAAHLSTLTLANPDAGPAVADVTIWSADGQLDQVESRGLTIVGGKSSTLALEKLAPHARELAVRVVVSRGRLAASMRDEHGKVGEALRSDALPSGAPPADLQVLPALTRKASSRVLTLVNPGRDEIRVAVRIAGARSTFDPNGVEEIRVPAGRVVVTDLTRALEELTAAEDVALVVQATGPVAAGLRSTVAGDLVHNPALLLREEPSAAVVPATGTSTLLVTAGEKGGKVRISWDGGAAREVTLAAGTTRAVAVPAGARRVVVEAGVPVASAIRTQASDGATLLPLRALVTDLLVPSVRPEWPPR